MPMKFRLHALLLVTTLAAAACDRGPRTVAPLEVDGRLPAPLPLVVERPALLPELPAGSGAFLNKGDKTLVEDPVCYVTRPASIEYWSKGWSEHPDGQFKVRTNSHGMREDLDPLAAEPDLRVLVAGDSHTDGVVNNAESFPNILEARLAERWPDGSIEVLNAGVGSTSFPMYLGTLVKFLALEPDVFVCTVYSGNDFGYMVHAVAKIRQEPIERADAPYFERLAQANALPQPAAAAVNQLYNQRWRWAYRPQDVEPSMELSLDYTREMARLCEQRGVRFIVLHLPSADAVEVERWAPLCKRLDEVFGFDAEQAGLADRFTDRYLETLRGEGIEVLDGRVPLRQAAAAGVSPLYWSRDLHLGVEGHRILGEALCAAIPGPPDQAPAPPAGAPPGW